MPTTLDRIEIEGFKSIRQLRLDLKPLNVLIGANGAGKSNFISVFGLLRHIVDRRLQFYVARQEAPTPSSTSDASRHRR